jgi:hypothetical protein
MHTSHPLIIYDVLEDNYYADINNMASLALIDFFDVYDSTSDKIEQLKQALKETSQKIEFLHHQEATTQNLYNKAAELEHKLQLEEKINIAEQDINQMEHELKLYLEINTQVMTHHEAFIEAKEQYHAEKVKHSILNYIIDYGDPTTWLEKAQNKAEYLTSTLEQEKKKLSDLNNNTDNNTDNNKILNKQIATVEALSLKTLSAQEKVSEFTKLVELEERMLIKKSVYQETLNEQKAYFDNHENKYADKNVQELNQLISQKTNHLDLLKKAHEITTTSLDTIDDIYHHLVESLACEESHFTTIASHLTAMGCPLNYDINHHYKVDFTHDEDVSYVASTMQISHIPPIKHDIEVCE